MEEINTLFTDVRKLNIHFELPAQEGGEYILRTYSINQKYGSLADAWAEMGADEELSPEDTGYLARVSAPRMVRSGCEEHGGKIRFDTVLEPNEMQFIHVTFKYA